MTRNLKALGLVLTAMLAMGALLAGAASAEETKPGLFTMNVKATERAGIDGVQIGTDSWTVEKLQPITCTTSKLKGTASTVGTSSTEVTLAPTYETCHQVIAGITKTVTFTSNGCNFKLNAKTTLTNDKTIDKTATTDLECPKEGDSIQIHVYNETAKEVSTICTFDLEPQGALSGVTLNPLTKTPTLADDVEAGIGMTFIVRNTIQSPACGMEAFELLVFKGNETLQATTEAGVLADLSASD